jgi:fatty acid elongase 3
MIGEIARSTRLVAGVLAVYVFYVAFWWGRNAAPKAPRALLVVYNWGVALYSLVYACVLARAVAAHAARTSLWHVACAPTAFHDAALQWLFEMHVVARLVELADTVLIVHSSRPLSFLHVYHHAATLALAHLQLVDHTPIQWITILLNALVHFCMYAYYARCAAGARPRWKRAITILQILQFVVILGVYGGLYAARVSIECYATPRATFWGFAVIISYLVLFLRFFAQTYGRAHAKPA